MANRLFKLSILMVYLSAFFLLAMEQDQAQARVIVKERVTYYTVSGKTGKQLYKSIAKRGRKLGKNRHAIATTRSQIKIKNIKARVRGRKCVVASANVHLSLTYRYPRWKNQRGASPRVRKAWKKFIARAIVHEKRHGKIAKETAQAAYRALRRSSGRVSLKCKNFGRNAARKLKSVFKRGRRRHHSFDRREARVFSRSTRLQIALYKSR